MTKRHSTSFIHNLIGGNSGKVWLEGLFQLCGYATYPYGYESTVASLKTELNDIRMTLRKSRSKAAPTRVDLIDRITSSPDLIVIDRHLSPPAVRLVEVKTCKQNPIQINGEGSYVWLPAFPKYLQYWPDALIVILCSHRLSKTLWGEEKEITLDERILCAQVKKIKSESHNGKPYIDLNDDSFKEFSTVFPEFEELNDKDLEMLLHTIDTLFSYWDMSKEMIGPN